MVFSGRNNAPAEDSAISANKTSEEWDRLALQVPASLAKRFRDLAHSDENQRGVKLSGTAATALWIGLPANVRAPLLDWAARVERDPKLADSPEAAATVFATILRSLIELRGTETEKPSNTPETESEENTGWFVDRILDPQILLGKEHKKEDRETGTA